MSALIALSDGTKLTVPMDVNDVRNQIQKLSPEKALYGDWLMLGDDDETYFNPAHVIYVRAVAAEEPAVPLVRYGKAR
jgi:hypothetical protein